MNDFTYDFPVRNYFGKGAARRALEAELPKYGPRILLAYGGGSIKRTGVYDEVMALLTAAGKEVSEVSGVMSNPTYDKVQEVATAARANDVDLILAVGGGSVFDCCKVASAQAKLPEGVGIREFEREQGKLPRDFVPLACIVTLSGTGAEQNDGGVITDEERHEKGPYVGALADFAALDPSYTLTVPAPQFMSGAFDTLSHCMETYFGTPRTPNVSDGINFAVQRNVIRNMRAVLANDADLEARSELVYDSALAENGLLKIGKRGDFQAHMIQHQFGAYTHTNHGLGLAVIHPRLYRVLAPAAPEQFARWAQEVWGVAGPNETAGRDELAVALDGIAALEAFTAECGLPASFSDMGVVPDDGLLRNVARTAIVTPACARQLNPDEIFQMLADCR